MKLVIDTNVFVSGAIWHGIPGGAVSRVFRRIDVLFLSDNIFNEMLSVFSRAKFDKYRERVDDVVERIKKIGITIAIPPDLSVLDSGCRDPKDIMYLECAIAGNADYLISGDADLRVLRKYRNVTIVNPREYLDIVGV